MAVCCLNAENHEIYHNINVSPYHNVALFKSLLQKCVCRQMTDMALKTTRHPIQLDLKMIEFYVIYWLEAIKKEQMIDTVEIHLVSFDSIID